MNDSSKQEEEVSLVPLREEHADHIKEALYKALHNPGGEPLGEEVLKEDCLLPYYEFWGREDDYGFAAIIQDEVIGVCWCRLIKGGWGFGYIDDDTPELSIAVWDAYRDRGIGTKLLDMTIRETRLRGYRGLSLSVQRDNRSASLYRRMGFKEVSIEGDAFTMYLDLAV
jgi:ribosomal protein S18 acetylase RimI-like enzyme